MNDAKLPPREVFEGYEAGKRGERFAANPYRTTGFPGGPSGPSKEACLWARGYWRGNAALEVGSDQDSQHKQEHGKREPD